MSFHGQAKAASSGRVGGPGDRPVEIAFLARHGVSGPVLDEAARLASATGVSGDDALVRAGLIDEGRYYRALADELERPFLREGFALDPAAPSGDTAVIEIARLGRDEPARYVIAPTRARLSWLLSAGRPVPADFAVTTPTALRDAVFAVRGPAIADEAANGLVRAAPHLSIRGGPNRAQIAAGGAILAICGVVGTQAWPLAATMVFVLSSAAFLAMVTLRLTAAQYRAPITAPSGPRWDDRDLPTYTVLVALHRESGVLPQLLAALAALDFPAPKLDIKLILETGDEETSEALARLPLPPFVEVIVAPPGEPRTKPRALNVALPLARGEFLVVYDAEDRPDPGQLRDAVATFARLGDRVACLQGRLVIDNTRDSWLTRLFTVEYAALFDVINPALAALDWPLPLGGTSTHLRAIR